MEKISGKRDASRNPSTRKAEKKGMSGRKGGEYFKPE